MTTKVWFLFDFRDLTYLHKDLYCVNLSIKAYMYLMY
jgi:hypothetical protein